MSLHKPTVFGGVATALITPFRDGGLDLPALSALIELQIAGGVSALLVAGTTGEGCTLSFEELEAVTSHAKGAIRDRVPLLVGCGSNSTERACRLAQIACSAGADALLAVTPYYNKTTDRGILLHYEAIAAASTRPILIYNVPSRTGFSMNMKHYRELAKMSEIVGVKEASGDLALLESLCSECSDDLDVYTGNDDQTLAAMKLGAIGVISVASNLLPRKMSEICRLYAEGKSKQASARLRAIKPLLSDLFCEVNPVPVKYLASLMGLCRAEYRLPLCPPSPESVKRLGERLPLLVSGKS